MIGGSDGHARVVGGPWSIGKMLMLDDKGVIDDVESLQLLGVPGRGIRQRGHKDDVGRVSVKDESLEGVVGGP